MASNNDPSNVFLPTAAASSNQGMASSIPPLSPRTNHNMEGGIGGAHHRLPNDRTYAGRQMHAPLSPNAAAAAASHDIINMNNNRSRSLSLGNQPLGWSPKRSGPLSPVATAVGGNFLPGLPLMMNNMNNFPQPPSINEQQRAMEGAVQKERTRTKAMEVDEASLGADELRIVLKRERHRMARLAADLASMKSLAVQSVAQAEVSEEGRINNLMRRLEGLQQEKGRIIVELEREEEMLTNNLQKKLNKVQQEKVVLEKHQMSRSELEARLKAVKEGPGGDFDMSEALEEKEEEIMEEGE